MEVLFDGNDIGVELSRVPGASAIVVTFSTFTGAKGIVDYFGQGYLERRGFSVLYIVARQSIWWQTPEMAAAIAIARETLDQLGLETITYGGSMGAYGAILFAGDLGATRVVAVSPQVTLADPSILQREWVEIVASRPILRDDMLGTIDPTADLHVIYDPRDARDGAHIRMLTEACARRCVSITRYLVPFSTHFSLDFLLRCGILSDIASDLLKGAMPISRFRTAVRGKRAGVDIYRTQLDRALARRAERSAG